MRHAVWLSLLGVIALVLGVGAARAAGGLATTTTTDTTTTDTTTTDTTTTDTTTTDTTTTGTTTTTATTTGTTTTPSFAALAPSSLPAGCVGAGALALARPTQQVVAFGTPASALGPSVYETSSGSVLSLRSSTSGGSTCKSETVTLNWVSLFGGAITARSVKGTDGKGMVAGLEVNGVAVVVRAGQTVAVDGWGRLSLGVMVGRVRAPLVVRLTHAHDSLPAGTAIALAFAASARPVQKPRLQSRAHHKHRRHPRRPPPAFRSGTSPLLAGDALTPAARRNPVVSLAVRYLGVPYQWGGATPKVGFDCSGLVKYVFGQFGVSLPHFAASQFYSPDAISVTPKQLHAGDLVFFTGSDGTRKEPGHVGIYIGDGYLIDAPHTGAFVQVDNLDERWFANNYVGARRIVAGAHIARPLADMSTDASSVPTLPRVDLLELVEQTLGEPRAVAHTSAQPAAPWKGAGLGVVSFGLLAGVAVAFRRRRRTPE